MTVSRKNKNLWDDMKNILNNLEFHPQNITLNRSMFINHLLNQKYFTYINSRRSIESIYSYLTLLKKANFIKVKNNMFILIRKIPIDLTVREAKLIGDMGTFISKDEMML